MGCSCCMSQEELNLKKSEQSVAKIYKESESEENNDIGFLCKIPFPNKSKFLPVLLTNNTILKKEDIELNKKIKISLFGDDNKEIEREIIIDEQTKKYINQNYSITIIEIRNIFDKMISLFLEMKKKIDESENNEIYILKVIKGSIRLCKGKIENIKDKYFEFSCKEEGVSNSLILSPNSSKVIGISKETSPDIIKGIFIEEIIREFYDNYKYTIKFFNVLKNTIQIMIKSYENGKYYLGESKNELEDGRGIEKKENNVYKGFFEKGKYKGFGIFYEDNNEEYYEGYWLEGKKHGFGIIYYNKKEKFYGTFENNEKLYGIEFYENGNYYEGNWLKDKKEGLGTEYSKEGKTLYTGKFINGKYEGNGTYYYKNGDMYDGDWKGGERNGLGKLTDKKGTIKYDGNWKNDKRHGEGTIYENGKPKTCYFENDIQKDEPFGKH